MSLRMLLQVEHTEFGMEPRPHRPSKAHQETLSLPAGNAVTVSMQEEAPGCLGYATLSRGLGWPHSAARTGCHLNQWYVVGSHVFAGLFTDQYPLYFAALLEVPLPAFPTTLF